MKPALAILPLLLAAPPAAASDEFPLETIKNFQRIRSLPKGAREIILDSSRPGLSAVVRYSGEERQLPENKEFFLETLAKALDSDFFGLYTREVRVQEQGRTYWVPIQPRVLESFRKEIDAGDELTLQLRYFGAFGDVGRLYLAIDFSAGASERVPRTGCFSQELGGVRVGDPYAATLKRLEARYGEPYSEEVRSQRRYHAFVVDRDRSTSLVIGDAGASYRGRVFSVQLSGPANPDVALFRSLRLGASPGEVESVLGKPVEEEESGDGYTQLSYVGTNCSVELKDGRLASFLIAGDPNYFEE